MEEPASIYLPPHLPCFSHTLNLLASADANKALTCDAAYKRIYRSMSGKCTSLSNTSHQSSKASEVVHDELARTIPKPNSTRWNLEFGRYCVKVSVTLNVAQRSFKVVHVNGSRKPLYDFIKSPLIVTFTLSSAVSVLYAPSQFFHTPVLFRLKFGVFHLE